MLDTAIRHYQRAAAYVRDFERASSRDDKERHLASAVENAVAIVECWDGSLPQLKLQELAWNIPRFRLLKRVRIHNFHRQLVPYYPPQVRSHLRIQEMLGPITLETAPERGSADWFAMSANGPVYGGSKGGKVVRKPTGGSGHEKEILIIDGKLWDEYASSCVTLDDALRQYLARVPRFLDQIQQVVR